MRSCTVEKRRNRSRFATFSSDSFAARVLYESRPSYLFLRLPNESWARSSLRLKSLYQTSLLDWRRTQLAGGERRRDYKDTARVIVPRHWNKTPLISFGRTGVIETCTFHSCPDIRGCTGMYCTAS